MKHFSTWWTTLVVVIIILAFGFIKPMPTEASEVAQIYLQATPTLVVGSIECESHIRVQFLVRNAPAESEITSHGQVDYILNNQHQQARFVGQSGTTARYNEFLAPANGWYRIASAHVTITTTTGSLNLTLVAPYEVEVTSCQSPVTATPTATLTATNTATNTPTLTATATPTGTVDPTASPTATLTATNTPIGTIEPSVTPSSTLDVTPTATATTTTPVEPRMAQCGWVVPPQYVGHAYYVEAVGGGEQYGDAYPFIEYKPEGPWVWVMFDVGLAGLTGQIVDMETGEIILVFQFLANGQGNDELGNCFTELVFRPSSSPTATPSATAVDDSCVNCGPPTQERIPTNGILVVEYALCRNKEHVCDPDQLQHFKVYQGEVNFSVVIDGVRVDAQPVVNERGTFYILDGVAKEATTQLINPDGTLYTGPYFSTPACSVWPTFARLDGNNMTYWPGATKSDVAEWLRDEFETPFEVGMAYAIQLSQKPYRTIERPQ